MGPYEADGFEAIPLRDRVFKRPGMYFGDMTTGNAYAAILHDIIEAALSWKIGANLVLELMPGNRIRLTGKARMPDIPISLTVESKRPMMFYQTQETSQHEGLYYSSMYFDSCACQSMLWETRDANLEHVVLIKEGICKAVRFATPNLPMDLCLRVNLIIGSSRLSLAPATLDEVAKRIRYLSGPAGAGYWGHVMVHDRRTHECRSVRVTAPPPYPWWKSGEESPSL